MLLFLFVITAALCTETQSEVVTGRFFDRIVVLMLQSSVRSRFTFCDQFFFSPGVAPEHHFLRRFDWKR